MHKCAEVRELTEARETGGQAARIQALPGLRVTDVTWLHLISHFHVARGPLIQGVLPARCEEKEALERTAGAIAVKEPMMKRAPPQKKPAAAYQEIQWAGVSKYIQKRNSQSQYSSGVQFLQAESAPLVAGSYYVLQGLVRMCAQSTLR